MNLNAITAHCFCELQVRLIIRAATNYFFLESVYQIKTSHIFRNLLKSESVSDLKLEMFLIVCYSLFFILEKAEKGKMRKVVCAFFQTACETVKHCLPCHDSDNIEPPTPDPDLDNSEPVRTCWTRSVQISSHHLWKKVPPRLSNRPIIPI